MAGVSEDRTTTEGLVVAGVSGDRTIAEGLVMAGVSIWV